MAIGFLSESVFLIHLYFLRHPFTATVSCGHTIFLTFKMFILGFCSDQQKWSCCHVYCVPSHEVFLFPY